MTGAAKGAVLAALALLLPTAAPTHQAAASPGSAAVAQPPPDPGGRRPVAGVQGLVLGQSGPIFTIVTRGNTVLTVILGGTAAVGGRDSGAREDHVLMRGSIVEVAGPRNSDGSLSAQSVSVLFDVRRATRVSGRIIRAGPEGLVLADGTTVAFDDVWVIRGTTLLPAASLAPGVGVLIYGTGRGGRIIARVVEVAI